MADKTYRNISGISPSFIVGIGASAGGLEALQNFFDHIPPTTGIAFIVIQHLSPNFKSLMDELLSKHTDMEIVIPDSDTPTEPNKIYLNRRDKNLVIDGEMLRLSDRASNKALNLPIDIFLHSLGETYAEKSIAVILSGTGSDGSRGLRTIKGNGGMVFVQEPATAQFDGMPLSAIRTNLVDFVGGPEELAAAVANFPSRGEFGTDIENDIDTAIFAAVLDEVSNESDIDFSRYKTSTLLRRIQKRMDLLSVKNLPDYLELLQNSSKERLKLSREFLISVTNFFRDPEAFVALRTKVLEELCRGHEADEPLRIWIAGCATGEEAYSMAILLDDYIRENKLHLEYKIFATDIDKDALMKASSGFFPINIVGDTSPEQIQNYFVRTGDQFQIIKRIRDRIVFSVHNVIKDPPFIRLDFISCRNLLIYLKPESQGALLENFRFSLNKGGFLFLGSSENIDVLKDGFQVVDAKWRIYRSTSTQRPLPTVQRPQGSRINRNFQPGPDRKRQVPVPLHAGGEDSFTNALVETYTPPCIIIDEEFDILYSRGKSRELLRFSDGVFSPKLTDMVDDHVAAIIREGIRNVSQSSKQYQVERVPFEGTEHGVRLLFRGPLNGDDGTSFYIIEVHEEAAAGEELEIVSEPFEPEKFRERHIAELEEQLHQLSLEKQNVVEELETSNEELQSSNEELMASNEELQSTNEELQSVNEELYTVNTELQIRNRELSDLSADLNNLLMSTRIAVLFLDTDLKIRKFTPEIMELFNLKESDTGRSIHDFAVNFVGISGDIIVRDAQQVMDSHEPVFRTIVSKDGRQYIKRITPFYASGGGIGGVVVTFVDVTDLQETKEQLEQVNATLEQAFLIGNLAWWDWDFESGRMSFHPRKAELLGYDPNELEPTVDTFIELLHPDDYDKTMQAMRDHLEGKVDHYTAEYRLRKRDGGYRWLKDRGIITERDENGAPERLIGVVIDIDETQRATKALAESEGKFRALFETMAQGVVYHERDGSIVSANPAACRILGLEMDGVLGANSVEPNWEAIHEDGSPFPGEEHPAMVTLRTGKPVRNKVMGIKYQSDGSRRWLRVNSVPVFREGEDEPILTHVTFDDITDIKEKEEIINNALKEKDLLLREIHHRVKNNLQRIISMLNLQSHGIEDEKVMKVFEESRKRIYIMALIHEKLYKGIDVAKIDAEDYFKGLAMDIISMSSEGKQVVLKHEIEQASLDIDTVISCGLIINELISNSLKHAFPKGRAGTVTLHFTNLDDGRCSIAVEDDGVGIPPDFDIEQAESLGLKLVRALVTQLDGELNISGNTTGTSGDSSDTSSETPTSGETSRDGRSRFEIVFTPPGLPEA